MKRSEKVKNKNKGITRHPTIFLVTLFLILLASVQIYAGNNNLENLFYNGELESFIDDFILTKIKEEKIPGAAVTVVEGENLIFSKGYGLADIENNLLVDSEKTVFRMASLAKLFTVTGVMQLVEKGEISLDDDVEKYINAQIIKNKAVYIKPITIRHLLTHTEGLEGNMIALKTLDGNSVMPMDEFLLQYGADRIMEPGQMITYGNYATGILGLIIEEVSGQYFAKYMKKNIFDPLNMADTSFEQPPAADIMSNRAGEYRYDDSSGEYVRLIPSYSHLVSSGGFHSTPRDISKFTIALLSDEDSGILSDTSKKEMFTQQFTGHPGLPGITFGLFELFENGQRILIRDGDSEGFRTRLMIIPEHNLALFITYNSDEGLLRKEILSAFLDRFFPLSENGELNSIDGFEERSESLEGIYNFVQYSHSTFAKIVSLFTAVKVRVNEEDRTIVTEPSMEEPFGNLERNIEFVEIEPYLYRAKDEEIYISFDKSGNNTYLYSGSGYHGSYEKLTWYQNTILHQIIFLILIILFLFLLVYSLRKNFRKTIVRKKIKFIQNISRTIILLNLVFILGLIPVIMLFGMTPGLPAFVKGVNILMIIQFTLPIIALLLMILMIVLLVKNWRVIKKGRWYYLSIIMISTLYYILLNYWNLFGYHFAP